MLPTNPNPVDHHRSEGNVDQIRDILFGGQMREYEHRFAVLERQTSGDHERLRLEIEERFRNLAEQSTALLRQLGEQLQAERSARATEAQTAAQAVQAATEAFTRQLAEAGERYEGRLREQAARVAELETQLRHHETKQIAAHEMARQEREALAAQLQAAQETARKEREALAARFDEQLRQLTGAVAEREALSQLFTEMAGRLRRLPQPSAA